MNDWKEYRKTSTIRALQWWPPGDDRHIAIECVRPFYGGKTTYFVQTLEGPLGVSPGDWIAKGIKGEHWAIKPDVFAQTYAAVNDNA